MRTSPNTPQPASNASVDARMVARGDFARGERADPRTAQELGDFATGLHRPDALLELGDFAAGMHALHSLPDVGDFATGLRAS
jgi:hypothetical protein